jgi:hypothetical protein
VVEVGSSLDCVMVQGHSHRRSSQTSGIEDTRVSFRRTLLDESTLIISTINHAIQVGHYLACYTT